MDLRERLRELFGRRIPQEVKLIESHPIAYTKSPHGQDVVVFPQAKTDFADTEQVVSGRNGFDLSNAFAQGIIVSGDLLEFVYASKQPDQEEERRRLLYLEPDHALFGGMDGSHKFLPERPYAGMPELILERVATPWEKVGHVTPEEWKEMMRETFKDRFVETPQEPNT